MRTNMTKRKELLDAMKKVLVDGVNPEQVFKTIHLAIIEWKENDIFKGYIIAGDGPAHWSRPHSLESRLKDVKNNHPLSLHKTLNISWDEYLKISAELEAEL